MIETPRLVLRDWRHDDLDPFAAMSADAQVMTHLGGVIDRAKAAAVIDRLRGHAERGGLTFWAIERRADAAFLGFAGSGSAAMPARRLPRSLKSAGDWLGRIGGRAMPGKRRKPPLTMAGLAPGATA